MNFKIKNSKGSAIIFVVVFSAVLSLIISGVLRLALTQKKLTDSKELVERAFDMAEAGLAYAKWYISGHPNDYEDGTGGSGPYLHNVFDPQGAGQKIGNFSLSINPTLSCGKLQFVDIESVGYSAENPNIKRKVSARLAYPTVAEFSYIIDSDVWAGSTRQIVGPYHSNGGIRMDGTNNSTVSSAKSQWWCDASFGCSPEAYKPGVFGSGPNNNLWRYPSGELNFANFDMNFSELKDLAQNHGGIYLSAFTGNYGNDRKGYQLVFKSNGTVDIYRVNNSSYRWGYRSEYAYNYSWSYGWRRERNRITSRTFLGNYDIPPACSLIFSEEKLWIQGTVEGKLAVVAARVSGPYRPEIVLNDDIYYKDSDGSDGLTAFAQSYILIPEFSPYNMEINGLFIAQNGSFGRSYYSNNKKGLLTINGTVVSRGRVGTSWSCSGGSFCSGYSNRINSYDRFLRTSPPPFTPKVSGDLHYVSWSQD